MLKIGERAPEFFLPDQNGHGVSLSWLLRDGPVLLFLLGAQWNPLNFLEARRVAALYPQLHRHGFSIAGLSAASSSKLRAFRDRHQLPYPLLSDRNKTVIRMYDARGLLGTGVRRTTYLISGGRQIRGAVRSCLRLGIHTSFMEEAPDLIEN